MDRKMDTKMDRKMDIKMDRKMDTKMDRKMDTKMDRKMDTNNINTDNKMASNMDNKMASNMDNKMYTHTSSPVGKKNSYYCVDIWSWQLWNICWTVDADCQWQLVVFIGQSVTPAIRARQVWIGSINRLDTHMGLKTSLSSSLIAWCIDVYMWLACIWSVCKCHFNTLI